MLLSSTAYFVCVLENHLFTVDKTELQKKKKKEHSLIFRILYKLIYFIFLFNIALQRFLMNSIPSVSRSRMFWNSNRIEQATWDGKKQRYSEQVVLLSDEIVLFTEKVLLQSFFFFPHLVIFLLW